jgi:hypothetical protein
LNEAENIDQTLGAIIENIGGRFDFEIIVTDGGVDRWDARKSGLLGEGSTRSPAWKH